MGRLRNLLRVASIGAAFAALGSLAGCGAGLITGIVAGDSGSSTAEVQPPELSLTPVLPLVPAANTLRTVVVTNAQVPTSARVRVMITAAGVAVDQLAPTISGQGGSTAITFTLTTGPIVGATGDPTAGDVAGELGVLVDDQPIAPPVPILLARQPRAELSLGPGAQLFLSPFGEAASLRVTGLQSVEPANLQMFVSTRVPEQPAAILTRPCSNLVVSTTGAAGEAIVTATVPGNAFPDRAQLFVRDAVSGESTDAVVYYRPEITLALPRQGPTTGGNLVTLIGTALVPHDFSQQPAPLSFADVDLSFEKGGRIVPLAREDFREELSAGDRLVFRMPASPDGRPGQVDIVLRAQLQGVVAQVTVSEEFLFAIPNPFFGPRGAVLDEDPIAVVPIALDDAPGGEGVLDFAVLTEQAGAGFLQLLLAQDNGMFLRFGARRRIGDHEVAAERNPNDLSSADFDGDNVPDIMLVNGGAATAVHHIVLGQAKPATPLGAVHRFSGAGGMAACRIGDFDGDTLQDVLLVPGPAAPSTLRPQVWLSRPVGVGQPAFAPPITVPVRSFSYQAIEVADLDGDSVLDVAVVDGMQLKLDVAYGRGDGTFDPAVPLDFGVVGYVPDPNSTAVGLHACGNVPQQSLGLVLSGDKDGEGSDPDGVIAVLHQTSLRVFDPPSGQNNFELSDDPVGVTLVVELDEDPSPQLELVTAARDDPGPTSLVSMAVFEFNGTQFTGIGSGVQIGGELPRQFRALHYGRAFPESPIVGEGNAVFAVHESNVDGTRERRLSTLLVFDGAGTRPQLVQPDAGTRRDLPVLGLVGGNWSETAVAGQGSLRDLAVARFDGIDVIANDGFGGFPLLGPNMDLVGLLPQTIQLLPAPAGLVESLGFFDVTSRFGVWGTQGPITNPNNNSQSPDHLSGELRLVSPNGALQSAALNDTTRVQVADVDGDGIRDVVALLKFDVPSPTEGDAMLALLRGKANPLPNEPPFFEPTTLTPVHGKATGFALGDFAAVAGSPVVQLELALAVPDPTNVGGLDGDHVRFYRYVAGQTPAGDRFEPSAAAGGPQVLLAGSRPMALAADDFDSDGLVDLLVAAAGDDALRLFRNVALPAASAGHVEIGSFIESLSSPRAMSPGTPTHLRLGDVNGDGATDVIVAVESGQPTNLSTSVAFYLSEEPGVLSDAEFVSPSRLGNKSAAMTLDLGDWNRDGVLDLFVGWDVPADFNVRVLFGGSR